MLSVYAGRHDYKPCSCCRDYRGPVDVSVCLCVCVCVHVCVNWRHACQLATLQVAKSSVLGLVRLGLGLCNLGLVLGLMWPDKMKRIVCVCEAGE